MKKYDVCIVGGGPVGGYIAGRLAEKKFNVAVFEKNKEIGIPIKCAGLITPRVFELLNISKKEIIQNKIKGAHVYPPSGKILTIGGDRLHAYAINRVAFDKKIINYACEKGAGLYLENNVVSAKKDKDSIEIKTSKNIDARCKLLIGADGPYSIIRSSFAFSEPKEFLRGIGAEVTNVTFNPDFVEIFIGNNIAPGFFAWVIPTDNKGTTARVGLCISNNSDKSPKFYFKKLFNRPPLKEAIITNKTGGVIPLGLLKKTYDSNLMLVGDAAAQVKPTSGGGLYPGLVCADICSKIAIQALHDSDYSIQTLKKYQKLYTKEIGKELFLGMKFRQIFKNLSDKKLDKYIERLNNQKIIEIINKYGDIDYPSKLAKPLIKKIPTLLKLTPEVIKK